MALPQTPSVPPAWLLRQSHLRLFIAPALIFVVCCLDRQFQTDFWMHLARGCEILQTHCWIAADHFTIAARGATIRDPNWLSQVIYARLFQAGGLELIQTVNALLLAISAVFLIRLCRREDASTRATGAAAIVFFLLSWQTFLIRPQSFSVLLFVLLYSVLRARDPRATLIGAPLILLLWVNMHGAFGIGLALIACFALGTLFDRAPDQHFRAGWHWLALLLSGAVTLLNPYGWQIYTYAATLTARVAPRHLEEWMAPRPGQMVGLLFIFSAVAICACYYRAKRRPTSTDLILLVGFAILGLQAVRMIIWWAIVLTPILARALTLAEREPAEPRAGSWAATLATVLLVVLCVSSIPRFESLNPLFRSVRSPHRLETDLDKVVHDGGMSGAPGGVFARMEWAQYLTWRLGPANRLFIDSHVELYDDAAWREYRVVSSGSAGWEKILDRRGVDFLLLDRLYHPVLLQMAINSQEWVTKAAAGDAILLVRKDPPPLQADSGQFSARGRYRPEERPDSVMPNWAFFTASGVSNAPAARKSRKDAMLARGPAGGNRQFYGR